jgi:hypothetical protein
MNSRIDVVPSGAESGGLGLDKLPISYPQGPHVVRGGQVGFPSPPSLRSRALGRRGAVCGMLGLGCPVSENGTCVVCGLTFSFNPELVPSVRVNGVRTPICRECVEHANGERMKKGLSLIEVKPGAYDVEPEGHA